MKRRDGEGGELSRGTKDKKEEKTEKGGKQEVVGRGGELGRETRVEEEEEVG